MILFIDTSSFEETKIALLGKKLVWHNFGADNLSEKLLVEIKKFCQKQKIRLNKIKKIAVIVGPGSFSKIRTGVAIANALAYGLKVPVVAVKSTNVPISAELLLSKRGSSMVEPFYDKQPNITLAKK